MTLARNLWVGSEDEHRFANQEEIPASCDYTVVIAQEYPEQATRLWKMSIPRMLDGGQPLCTPSPALAHFFPNPHPTSHFPTSGHIWWVSRVELLRGFSTVLADPSWGHPPLPPTMAPQHYLLRCSLSPKFQVLHCVLGLRPSKDINDLSGLSLESKASCLQT